MKVFLLFFFEGGGRATENSMDNKDATRMLGTSFAVFETYAGPLARDHQL